MDVRLAEGFSSRPLTLEDVEAVVDLMNANSRVYTGAITDSVDEIRTIYQSPGFQLDADTRIVLGPNGRTVGLIEFWDTAAPHARYNIWGVVHPEFEGKGIGSGLIEWAVRRAGQSVSRAPEGAKVTVLQGVDSRQTKGLQLLEESGFSQVRRSYQMKIELNGQLQAPVLPEGFAIRPFQGEQEKRELLYALWEAFHDHWGFQPVSFEDYEKRWATFANLPQMDPSMWYIAINDGKVAGGCICSQYVTEDPRMGWVNSLGVKRAWRKHGLGLAFLRTAFMEFRRRGQERAGLGVDAYNLTGALRLYESAGMHVAHEFITFEKVIRDGVELSTQILKNDK